ncbi:MAG: TIM barrel protein [Firmicutes bacterium]|nr:TIM barrel protein [Bacillota bacterium]
MIKFGPSGNSASFYSGGYDSTCDAGAWCAERGLFAYEYSFGRGVRLSKETAISIGQAFSKAGVSISVHAPYYINFCNKDSEAISKSIGYVLSSCERVKDMGGNRVVIHAGSLGDCATREEALNIACDNFKRLTESLNKRGINDIFLCIETMGKIGQLGTVDEVIEIVKIDSRFLPCIDFGHVNAREQGILNYAENYNTLVQKLLNSLPFAKISQMHVHFSKIMYGARGELKHLTFEDTIYGPNYEPMIDSFIKHNLHPTVLCESDGTQAEDAVSMLKYYQRTAHNAQRTMKE